MARILICTHPFTGHVNPALVIARQLVQAGHDVRFYTGAKFKAKIEAAGAVQSVLANPQYKLKAGRIQAEFAKFDGASEAVRLVEQLLNTRKPVVNPQHSLTWQRA
ncbi:MAG: hypothetical protein LCI00_34125 [Chloroflexi bacterium]|nr:hypothetical protein [Chloroflexota bacterium]MCC6894454.1 hypothetical protein [Anaerolineae bacterium]